MPTVESFEISSSCASRFAYVLPKADLKKIVVSAPRLAKIVHIPVAGKIFLRNFGSSWGLR